VAISCGLFIRYGMRFVMNQLGPDCLLVTDVLSETKNSIITFNEQI